jgi:2-oxoglutarate dehydrogenase E2 component (dihydrolipoamide succinyltransferase)
VTVVADLLLPQLGETVTEGTITRWAKRTGDRVEADDVLYEVSTDKVESEVPAGFAGILTEIVVAEGATVLVGEVIARYESEGAAPVVEDPAPRSEAPTEEPIGAPTTPPRIRSSASTTSTVPPARRAPTWLFNSFVLHQPKKLLQRAFSTPAPPCDCDCRGNS